MSLSQGLGTIMDVGGIAAWKKGGFMMEGKMRQDLDAERFEEAEIGRASCRERVFITV